MRVPAASNKPRLAKMTSFPAPTGGWVANRNLAQPGGQGAPQGAAVLENWFPTATGAILRRGSNLYATLGDGSLPVVSIFSYKNGASEKLFAATSETIYDVSIILTPINYSLANEADFTLSTDAGDTFGEDSTIGKEALVLQTSGDWTIVQFATPGGVFLRGVNGADTPFVFDGTTWGTTPAITFAVGDTTTPAQLAYVWTTKNRLWFVKKESLDAYYLPVSSIGGEVVKFPMGGIFSRGGSLLFGSSWSIETGDGLNEHTVFVTTEGEVAVYRGADPSSATDWGLVGVYRIGRPLGKHAWIRAGGDLVIATDIGLVPLSQAMQRDYAALSPSAVSYPIETAWNEAVAQRPGSWQCEVWPASQMVAVVPPSGLDTAPEIYVANSRTGAWGKYTNWDATCLEVFKKRLFFGSKDGRVVEANVTGADEGATFTGRFVPLFDDLRTPGSLKIADLARATLRSSIPVRDYLSVNFDFNLELPPPPSATMIMGSTTWGAAIWGESVWGENTSPTTQQNWQSVGGAGYALAPALQVTSGATVPLDAEIVRVDVTYSVGDIVS